MFLYLIYEHNKFNCRKIVIDSKDDKCMEKASAATVGEKLINSVENGIWSYNVIKNLLNMMST